MAPERVTRRRLLASAATVGSAVTTGCLGSDGGSIRIPETTRVGDPVRLRVTGYDPNAAVTLDAVAVDADGRVYEGPWSLRTNDDGTAAPSRGRCPDNSPQLAW